MENKTGRYFKYAIGEIVLVVIGILIALQVNNWNERRKEFKKSQNNLIETLKDLKSDKVSFNNPIKNLTEFIQIEEWALNKFEFQNNHIDSIEMSISGRYVSAKINTRTFEKILNEGGSILVGFESLSDSINNYYTKVKKGIELHTNWDLKEVEEKQGYLADLKGKIEISNNILKTWGNGLYQLRIPMKQDSLERKRIILDFANTIRYRNHIKENYIRHLRLKKVFLKTKEKCSNLIASIEKELERK